MSPAGPQKTTPTREPPARLLLGPEEGEKSAFIEKITESITARGGEPPERTRFYAGETDMAEIIRCLRNMSLFARHRLVIVSNAEECRRAEDVAALVEYLASPAEDATLLLLSTGFTGDIDKKITGDQKKSAGSRPLRAPEGLLGDVRQPETGLGDELFPPEKEHDRSRGCGIHPGHGGEQHP